jgi:pimeloyl-ACP methyl ester carboxylesterase
MPPAGGEATMPFAERPGYRIHWQASGPEDAPPLLLIMGLGLGSDAWHELPEALSRRYRVVVFDNRGVGRSTASRAVFRIRDLAEDAVAVLDAAGVGAAFVFGISMGGMIAQELVLRHPTRVRALVLGATFGSHLRSDKPRLGVARDLLLTAVTEPSPRRLARILVADEFYATQPERFAQWLARLERPRRSLARRQILAIALHETERRLPGIRVDTLVVTGDRDRLVPPGNSRRLVRLIPGARFAELSGAGHLFPLERAADTVRLLTEHFSGARHSTSFHDGETSKAAWIIPTWE